MPQATYRQLPTGGVIMPMPRFTIMTMPIRYGLTPTLVMIGSRIGVNSAIADTALRNMPAISSRMLNISSKIYLLVVTLSSASERICGIWPRVSTTLNVCRG